MKIIGIAGGTGSGKTTIANKIKEAFKEDSVTILSHDFYYKSYDKISFEERLKRNYDHPDAYDTEMLIDNINLLKRGKSVNRPVYSYTTRLRENYTVKVIPTEIIIIEGMLIFENNKLSELMDLKIFVDTDADIRLGRIIARDTEQRGLNINYIIPKYNNTIKPMHEQFVEPSKRNADIIINNNKNNKNAVNMIINSIKNV